MLLLWLRLKTLWAMRRNVVRIGRLFMDQRVPMSLKALTAVGALVIMSPVDVLGDIPVLGMVDDTLLLVFLGWLFLRLCPPEVVAEYRTAAAAARLKNVTPS